MFQQILSRYSPDASTKRDWSSTMLSPEIVCVPLDSKLSPLDRSALERPALKSDRFYLVAPANATMRPDLVETIRPYLDARPDISIFYGDDIVVDIKGGAPVAHCKPAFNRALLSSVDYIGFPLIVRGAALLLTNLRIGARMDGAWYHFLLEALALGLSIDRIPHTLIAVPGPRAEASRSTRQRIIGRELGRARLPQTVMRGLTPDSIRVQRKFSEYPFVTLVIPTCQSRPDRNADGSEGTAHIINFMNSLNRSTWPLERIKVLIGDDVEDETIYHGRKDQFACKRIVTARGRGESFNYASKMNALWRAAETELIVLMNDDIVVRNGDWLEALYTFALEPDVGGVGARLIYPDGRIQHAGMFGGIHEVAAHPWHLIPGDAPTYLDWALLPRDCSMVTGAVFATRRTVLELANGFDEAFSLDFNDVDLCLRLRLFGYRIVYTPFAELTHRHSASRGTSFASGEEVALFLKRWREVLRDDPAYNPQLRTDSEDVKSSGMATRWFEEMSQRENRSGSLKSAGGGHG
jgi:O-antigen biosynthesis protein